MKTEDRKNFKDYYAILGVKSSATIIEINKAWRKRLNLNHPDRYAHASEEAQKEAHQRTVNINNAHDTLKDKDKRYNYDKIWKDFYNVSNTQKSSQTGSTAAPPPPPPPPPPRPKSSPPPPTIPRTPSSSQKPSQPDIFERIGACFRFLLHHWKLSIITLLLLWYAIFGITLYNSYEASHPNQSMASAPTPAGSPTVTINTVSFNANATDNYTVTGRVINPTAWPIYITSVGFYVGNHNPSDPPVDPTVAGFSADEITGRTGVMPSPDEHAKNYEEQTMAMISADIVPANGSITFKHSFVNIQPINSGAMPVTATLTFPDNNGDTPSDHWKWYNQY